MFLSIPKVRFLLVMIEKSFTSVFSHNHKVAVVRFILSVTNWVSAGVNLRWLCREY